MNPPAETAQRIARLAPLKEVLAQVETLARPVVPRDVALDEALGCVLATDVTALEPRPAQPVALTDGWAVRAELVQDAGAYSPVPLSSPPIWIEVGDRLPPDTDTVLPPDAVTARGSNFEAIAGAAPGTGVLAAGGNVERGAVLRRAGERLRASDIAALAALGVSIIHARKPNIRIGVTNPKLGHGIAGALLKRAIEAAGGAATIDSDLPLERALLDQGVDAVFVVGGTGQGKRDASVTALARVGRVAIHGFGIAPGETGALGEAGGRPVLLFPGRLDAALAVWLLVGSKLVARLAGSKERPMTVEARLSRKIASQVGIAEVVPVRRGEDGLAPLASTTLGLVTLARADGWVLAPAESEGFPVGAMVEMQALP
ncbi:MAG TPA: molybdopterin-binding protein [Xanthobacteraceae bacterium]|jgi:molybdopterin biosynthesis enzyme